MPTPIVIAQLACLCAGLACGGTETKIGGCLLLISMFLFAVGAGWWLFGKVKGGKGEKDR